MIADKIRQSIAQAAGVSVDEVTLEHPNLESFGDYSTNIALTGYKMSDIGYKSPKEYAQAIVSNLINHKSYTLDQIRIAGPGFINIKLDSKDLINLLSEATEIHTKTKTSKKVMVEFAHPNTHKAFHIGHLRNISTGEAIVRLLEANGIRVVRVNYQGDVGMHIAKAIYALTFIDPYKDQVHSVVGIKERVEFLGKAYAAGSNAYEEDEAAKEKIHDYNYLVYASAQRFQEEKGVSRSSTNYLEFVKDKSEVDKVYELWKETRQWSLDYFEDIYRRVGTHYDRYYFESECLAGVDLAKDAVEKGVLEKSEGAIIFNGKPYELDTRVFVNSLGLPTYEAKELALAKKEFAEFGELEKIIHVVGPEQSSFFQITFKAEELLGIQKDQQYHMTYGWVKLKHGKMSSRTGNVVLGEWLLDEVKKRVSETYKDSEGVSDAIAVGAVKYSFLKVGINQEIAFDIDESISFEGNSGPYLQYTYARTQSVLRKSQIPNPKIQSNYNFNDEELSVLRWIYRFSEVVEESALRFSPNLLCNFLYELAQRYNTFYNKHSILSGDNIEFRVILTDKVGQILKKGLNILGIEAPESM